MARLFRLRTRLLMSGEFTMGQRVMRSKYGNAARLGGDFTPKIDNAVNATQTVPMCSQQLLHTKGNGNIYIFFVAWCRLYK
jgi:hypothetical protein